MLALCFEFVSASFGALQEHADFLKMDADLAETVDMLTRAIGIIERELAKSAAGCSRKVGEIRIIRFLSSGECSLVLGIAHVTKVKRKEKTPAQDGVVHPERLDEEGDGRA